MFPGTETPFKSSLPRPEDFSRALYTFDIGQNDLAFGLQHTSQEQVIKSIPDILSQFFQAVQVSSPQSIIDTIRYNRAIKVGSGTNTCNVYISATIL